MGYSISSRAVKGTMHVSPNAARNIQSDSEREEGADGEKADGHRADVVQAPRHPQAVGHFAVGSLEAQLTCVRVGRIHAPDDRENEQEGRCCDQSDREYER